MSSVSHSVTFGFGEESDHLNIWISAGGGLVSALTAPRAGGVDQALVPGGGQGLNCNPEGDVHQ